MLGLSNNYLLNQSRKKNNNSHNNNQYGNKDVFDV